MTIVPGATSGDDVQEVPVLVSVSTPEGSVRMPTDICCVIDVSWSMSMEASVQSASGKTESNGLSMLDVAKHAVLTVIRSLGPQDRLAIVTFSRVACVVLPLTEMTEAGQAQAEGKLDNITFGEGTDLWQGIQKGLNSLRDGGQQGRLGHVMLLTDGETENKDQVMNNLEELKMKEERLPGTINCFGFGYEIDSQLLTEIATFSNGSYAFIPDAGFVGTIFVNSMSTLLVTMGRDAWLTLQAEDGASIVGVLGWESKSVDDIFSVNLGTLQYGQTKDVVLRMSVTPANAPYLLASLQFSTVADRFEVKAAEKPGGDPELVALHHGRGRFVDALKRAVAVAGSPGTRDDVRRGHEIIKEIGTQFAGNPVAKTEKGAALLEDILGQSCEALSSLDYWTKWGRHYTPSVMSAHMLQQCNNFKDPGVQFYGGKLFRESRDISDTAFDSLPPPKVTPAMYRYLGGGKVILNPDGHRGVGMSQAAPVARMAAYNDRYSGCIDGASMAQLASGEPRPVAALAKGDRVAASGGREAEVLCVVRTRCAGGRALLVELPGGARLTPHHPVFSDGAWRFPADLAPAEEVDCGAVFSLVLHGAPDLLVGGVPCVALGHGLEEGAAKHPYFGSARAVEDLAALPGYGSGAVELEPGFVRDPETGLVCGLHQPVAA